MEDIGLFKQGLKWIQTQKPAFSHARNAALCFRDKAGVFVERHWPVFCCRCSRFGKLVLHLLLYWRDCVLRGFRSVIGFGPAALLVIMWNCFLSLTSMCCLIYVVISIVSPLLLSYWVLIVINGVFGSVAFFLFQLLPKCLPRMLLNI